MKGKNILICSIIWIIVFSLYYIIGSSIFMNTNAKLYNDVLFGFDQSRVLFDYTLFKFPHYTQTTHPFFIIMVQPIIFLLNLVIQNKILSVLIFNTFLLTTNLFLFAYMMKTVNIRRSIRYMFVALYAVANGQILMTFIPETFTLSAFFLIIMHIFFIRAYKEKTELNWFFTILLGLISFGITITNVMQFFICLIIVLHKKEKDGKHANISFIKYGVTILILVFGISIAQKLIYKDMSSYFFNRNQMSATTRFIEIKKEPVQKPEIEKANFLHQIIGGGFGNTLLSSEIYKEKTDNGIIGLKYRQDSKRSFIAGILLLSIVIIAVIGLMRKNKKVVYLSSLCLLFNILLHCVFGRSEIHLYAQHYLFLILFIIGYSISKIESIEIRRVIAALIFLVLMYISYFNITKFMEIKDFTDKNYKEKISKEIPKEYLMYYNLTLTGKLKDFTDRGIYFYKEYIFVENSGNYKSIELEINGKTVTLKPENSIKYMSVRTAKDGKYVDIYIVNEIKEKNKNIKFTIYGEKDIFSKEFNSNEIVK